VRTVLLIDEDAASAKLERVLLEEEGWTVLNVATNDHARRVLHSLRPRLIVMDLVMPRELAFEYVRELKELAPTIPIVAVTGMTGPETELRALESGCTALIAKPIDVMTFAAQLETFAKENP
jgi:DNA-binding response OmpR family regulator